jgi:hypothetical protein
MSHISELSTHTHSFPNPKRNPEEYSKWVEFVQGNDKTPQGYDFYRKKILCHRHFDPRYWNRGNRLNALAVPTLYPPSEYLSPLK